VLAIPPPSGSSADSEIIGFEVKSKTQKLLGQAKSLLVRAKSFYRPNRLVLEDENADGGSDTRSRRLALIESLVSNVSVTPPLQSPRK
jgi:hypothetical protein